MQAALLGNEGRPGPIAYPIGPYDPASCAELRAQATASLLYSSAPRPVQVRSIPLAELSVPEEEGPSVSFCASTPANHRIEKQTSIASAHVAQRHGGSIDTARAGLTPVRTSGGQGSLSPREIRRLSFLSKGSLMVRGAADNTPSSGQLQRRVSWMDRSAGPPPTIVGKAGGQGEQPAPGPGPRLPRFLSPSTWAADESQTPRPSTFVKTYSQGNQRAVYPLPPSKSSELLRSTLKNAQRRSQTIVRDGGYLTPNSGKSTPKTASLDLVSLSVSTARWAGSNPDLGDGRRKASIAPPQSPASGPAPVVPPIRTPDRRSSLDRRASLSAPRPLGLASGFSQKGLVPSYRHFQLVEAGTPLASATPKSPFHGQFGSRPAVGAAAAQEQDAANKRIGFWGWMANVAKKIAAPFRTPKRGRPLQKRRFSVKNPEEAAREKAGW